MQSAAMAAAGAEAAAERKERRTDGRGRIPDERRNGRGTACIACAAAANL